MPVFLYASFPNSRNRFRTATVNANTNQIVAAVLGGPLTLVQTANPNRTYTLLTNLSQDLSLYYLYALESIIDPSAVATNGVPSQLIYNTLTNTIYQKQDSGTTINWTIVQAEDVAEVIQPLQTAGLEALGSIFVVSSSGVTTINVAYDIGRG